MILAIETATNVCSVAFRDEDGAIFEKRLDAHGSHSEKLFLFIEELMQEHHFGIHDLKALLVSEGPGSYTGLRIAASAVKGLLFERTVPLYSLNTLACFAMQGGDQFSSSKNIHCIIDARRVHFYYQKFTCHNKKLRADEGVKVIPITDFQEEVEEGDTIIGTGLSRLDEKIIDKANCCGKECITAQSLIRLFSTDQRQFFSKVDPKAFEPKYYSSNQVNSPG